jgi:hypothetical protein
MKRKKKTTTASVEIEEAHTIFSRSSNQQNIFLWVGMWRLSFFLSRFLEHTLVRKVYNM